MTVIAPVPAAAQNTFEGRRRVRSAEIVAVTIGNAPMTTAECAVDDVRRASVVSSGNPIASLPGHLDGGQLAAAALANGVALTPGDDYYPTDSSAPHIRLSYVAAPSATDVDDAIRRLTSVVAEP